MPARIHPGSLVHVWDHFVITLRRADGAETLLSLYAITYSATLGPGHVAFLRGFGLDGETLAACYADDPSLGERMQARLRAMGGSGAELSGRPIEARFERHPYRAGSLGFTIHAPDGPDAPGAPEGPRGPLVARWEAAGQPFWVEGPAPDFSPAEDIWACFVEANEASITLSGRSIPGQPYVDPVWLPKLGRALSSAHVALAEVRVTPHEGRRPG